MWQDFTSWLTNPLDTQSGQPSAWTLFLFLGLIIILLVLWGLIFRHIRAIV